VVIAPLVTGAAARFLEHAVIVLGQATSSLTGDLRQNLVEPGVKLLFRQNGNSRGLRT
jgi:hypothetical protein